MKETVSEQIGKLKKQGKTNNEIIDKLKKQGIVPTKNEARRQLNEYHQIYGTEMTKKYRMKKTKKSYKKYRKTQESQESHEIPIEELVRLREEGMKYEDIVKYFQTQGIDAVERIIADRIREYYRMKRQGNEIPIDENFKRTGNGLVQAGKELKQEEQLGAKLERLLKQTENDNER